MIDATRGEESLTRDEAISVVLQLLIAGSESSASAIASVARLLCERQGLQAQMRQKPAGIPRLIEEVLRLETPFQGHFRQTLEETVLSGGLVARGQPDDAALGLGEP